MQLIYRLTLIILLFVAGLIIALGVFPAINAVFPVNKARFHRDLIKKHWLKCFSLIVNLKIEKTGEESAESTLVVCNHISWLDIIVVGQFLPAYFVAKSDILGWPVIGYLARQAGTIFIRRGEKKHILATAERMVWLLKQNSNIIAFPEGTTTIGNQVLNFHASLFQPALLTKSSIQPVAIQYTGQSKDFAPFIGDDAFVPHLIRMLGFEKIEVKIQFLPTINVSGKTRNAICDEARLAIIAAMKGELTEPEWLENRA